MVGISQMFARCLANTFCTSETQNLAVPKKHLKSLKKPEIVNYMGILKSFDGSDQS